jgi:hypothetical protein
MRYEDSRTKTYIPPERKATPGARDWQGALQQK